MKKLILIGGLLFAGIMHSMEVSSATEELPENEPVVVVQPVNVKKYVVYGFLGGAACIYIAVKILVMKDNANLEAELAALKDYMKWQDLLMGR